MSSIFADDGYRVEGYLGRVPAFEDNSCVRVDEVAADGAAKQRPWDSAVWVVEGVSDVDFLVEINLAPGTGEGPVEAVETLCLGRKDVLVPLNRLENIGGVHLLDDAHKTTVGMLG